MRLNEDPEFISDISSAIINIAKNAIIGHKTTTTTLHKCKIKRQRIFEWCNRERKYDSELRVGLVP